MTQLPIDRPCDFQPCQILCLEHENACLYVEVVQVVAARQQCWVRPLVLTVATPLSASTDAPVHYDLRQGADLLWSSTCFRAALDTEVVPLLAQLADDKAQLEDDRLARQQLQEFMRRVWQTYRVWQA